MAQKSRPDPAGGNVVSADEYESISLAFAEDGVIGTPADTPVVYADSTGRQVKVRAGKTANVRGYQWFSDLTSDEIISGMSANTSGLPRIDRLVLRLDRSARTVRVVTLTGTPAAVPVAPGLTQNTSTSTGFFDFPLARWQVVSGYTTIAAADIVTEAWYPQAAGPVLCNSTSRPFGASLYKGLEIYELDSAWKLTWDGGYWRPEAGATVHLAWAAQNVGSLDNGNRTIWQINWVPPCPGTYRITTRTPFDGVKDEQAAVRLSVNGNDIGGAITTFAANSWVNEVMIDGSYWADTTASDNIYVWGTRIWGGSFYQSRSGNRWVEIAYQGPGNQIKNA